MEKQIITFLKQKINDISGADAEILRNAAKEEIQYYVLNFIYHHPEYSKWIMYGGSALRICYGLNRMSVDLDFEIDKKVTELFLGELKKEIENYFLKNYELNSGMLLIKIVNGRGLLLRFIIGDELEINHPSKQVHVKIDLNYFTVAKTVTERIPINRDQISFVIKTYNMSALMASKITAILLRGTRGVGKELYEEKGRDIYDLLWYMEKRAIPDLDYLKAKNIDISDLRALFDKLTIQMNKVSDKNLKQDLSPLFVNQNYINNWLGNWHESYLRLLESYKIRSIDHLEEIVIEQDINRNTSFVYWYKIKEVGSIRVEYTINYFLIKFPDGEIPTKINDEILKLVTGNMKDRLNDRLRQYATLFYQKTKDYFKKTNNVILGDEIATRTIRMTADNLNRKEQIVLNRSALLSCELEDLMK